MGPAVLMTGLWQESHLLPESEARRSDGDQRDFECMTGTPAG